MVKSVSLAVIPAFSVEARSQVHDPAGRAPEFLSVLGVLDVEMGKHTTTAAVTGNGVFGTGFVTTALKSSLLAATASGLGGAEKI